MKKTALILAMVMLGMSLATGCDAMLDKEKEETTAERRHSDDSEATPKPTRETADESKETTSEETVTTDESSEETTEETTEVTTVETTEETTIATEPEPIGYEVNNNCSYAVGVDDKVYFRVYGEDSVENPVVFTNFLYYPTGEQSELYYYDTMTGEVVDYFADCGYGDIVFRDGLFFMTGTALGSRGYNESYVYAVDMKGNNVNIGPYTGCRIVGNSDELGLTICCGSIYDDNAYVGEELFGLSGTGEKVFSIESPYTINYIGCINDAIIFSCYDYDRSGVQIKAVSYEAGTESLSVEREMGFISADYMTDINITQFIPSSTNDSAYIAVSYSEGTGHFFVNGELYALNTDIEGSLTFVDSVPANEFENMSSVIMNDDGTYSFATYTPRTYVTAVASADAGSALYYVGGDGNPIEIISDFIPGADYYTPRYILLHSESVNGVAYLMRAKVVYDENGSIGWRDGFRLLSVEYYKIGESGELSLLTSVHHSD